MKKDKDQIMRQRGTIEHKSQVFQVEYSFDLISGKIGLIIEGGQKLPPGAYEIKPE